MPDEVRYQVTTPDIGPVGLERTDVLLENRYRRQLVREFPEGLGSLEEPLPFDVILRLRPISEPNFDLLLEAAMILQERILDLLGSETLARFNFHLSCADFILVSESSGDWPYSRVGATFIYKNGMVVIGLALRDRGEPITAEGLASNLTHEVVHVADPLGIRLNYGEYVGAIEKAHEDSGEAPDLETLEVLDDRREMGPRVLEGSLFGTIFRDHLVWREMYRPVVRLVERDKHLLLDYGQVDWLQEKTVTQVDDSSALTESILKSKPVVVIACYRPNGGRPPVSSPLQRGVTRWAREQARQAADDHEREWEGALAEFDLLKFGHHPDPDPAAIILPEDPELYERLRRNHQLFKVDDRALKHADRYALRLTTRSNNTDGERLPYDPQRVAAKCRDILDTLISDDESRVVRQATYDARHPDEVPEVEVYSSLNKGNVETSLDYQI